MVHSYRHTLKVVRAWDDDVISNEYFVFKYILSKYLLTNNANRTINVSIILYSFDKAHYIKKSLLSYLFCKKFYYKEILENIKTHFDNIIINYHQNFSV